MKLRVYCTTTREQKNEERQAATTVNSVHLLEIYRVEEFADRAFSRLAVVLDGFLLALELKHIERI